MPYDILIVDDDTELQKMLKNYFRLKDYQVDTASDGVEAVEKAKSSYDVIILDVTMPGMDGIEVCKVIRESVECPIIFLTARSEEQDKINGLLSGGDDYISKPFSVLELEARVIAHLKREERYLNRNKVRDGITIRMKWGGCAQNLRPCGQSLRRTTGKCGL